MNRPHLIQPAPRITDVAPGEVGRLAPGALADALERGLIVRFPVAPIELPSPADQRFLRESVPALLSREEVGYDPRSDRTIGLRGEPAQLERVNAILREHGRRVEAFLARAIPELVTGWTVRASSLCPIEERGRNPSSRASHRPVHLDAGCCGATEAERVLRFFVNLNPVFDRVWVTRGTFAELHDRWGERAGLVPPPRLERGPLERLLSGGLSALSSLGVPLPRALASSPYDRALRRLHEFMELDPLFLAGRDGHEELRFGPLCAWMAFTDILSHVCTSGCYALVNTFLVPVANCRRRDLAPLGILRSEGVTEIGPDRPVRRASHPEPLRRVR